MPTILRPANVTELLLILKITLLITQPSARGDNARCQDSFILLAVTGWTELETLTQRFHWLLCSSPAPVSVPFVQFSQCCLRGCYRDHCLGCGMSFYSWEKALTIWLFRLTVARRRSSKLEMMNSQTHAILMRTHGIILNADKHLESYRFPLVCRTLLNAVKESCQTSINTVCFVLLWSTFWGESYKSKVRLAEPNDMMVKPHAP